jgi:Protein of unknown function (DUF2934)
MGESRSFLVRGLGEFVANMRDGLARRAYELFEARGYQHGNDLEDGFAPSQNYFIP